MTSISRRNLLLVTAGLAGVLQLGAAQAEDLNITIGYQTVVEPSKVAQADGAYEAATKAAIDWRKFDSGADVIAAIASGALDIGYVGSSPLAAAASRQLPIQTIFVVGLIGESEALVARNGAGVEKIADLAGKSQLRPSQPPRLPSSPAPSRRKCRRCSRVMSSRRSRSRLRPPISAARPSRP